MTYRPAFQPQLPDSRCNIGGLWLGAESCTSYAMAMLIDRSTLGAKHPSGCAVREATGDRVGGTTLPQNATAAKGWGVSVSVYTGSNVVKPAYAARRIRAGAGAVLQGNTGALIHTSFRSTQGPVNHAIYVNEVRGGTLDEPAEALVYDPCADGRDRTYHVDQGPSWWPWWLVKSFAAALEPNGDGTIPLGSGKFYIGFGPDTDLMVRLHSGARKASPLPDRTRARRDGTVVHSRPGTTGYRVGTLDQGELFVGYQYWQASNGSWWVGNQTNDRWVLRSRLSHVGGTT